MTIQMELTVQQLAALMKNAAGVAVDPEALETAADSGFDTFGLDSLGLLGIISDLENNHGTAMPPEAERCRTPREFIDLVNSTLAAGA
ncbi:acyl carrier protein [Streptomyces sp. NRRL S-87]|uniref:acyl carrier protein n=1 Tax=Streptomyces sp. NRRL S-87 TaxID=1463920 RepID=UPI00099D4B20|nr:acyl carrier protein [Streptomyces sp. NRRL S-87]